MYPSWKKCLLSSSPYYYESQDFWEIQCSGCTARLNLYTGANNGGHQENDSSASDYHATSRPLGHFPGLSQNVDYPISGSAIFVYEAPDNAGEVDIKVTLKFPGTSLPDDELNFNVMVKVPGLIPFPASTTTLTFEDIFSHVGNGHYMNSDASDTLETVLAAYRVAAWTEYSIANPETPTSEGASLSMGGLFDTGNDWSGSHCSHRTGKDIDLSMSAFDDVLDPVEKANQKTALKNAIEANDYFFPKSSESPSNTSANHWHARYNY